jgi:hypothetical protein
MEAAGKFTSMRIFRMVAGALLSASLVSAECVEVPPTIRPSSDRVRITARLDGKPLRGVKLEFFFANEQKPRLVLSTDLQGVVSASQLWPGFYRLLTTGPDYRTADWYLEARNVSPTPATSFEMSLVPSLSPLETRLAIAKKPSVTQRIHELNGVLLDPSGAAIPGAEIEILRKGSTVGSAGKVKADEAGHFNASLVEGTYVALMKAAAFRTEMVAFELTQKASSKELRISMRIGGC